MYEYSQSILFNRETFEIIASISLIEECSNILKFVDNDKNLEFYNICKSWDLFGSRISISESGVEHYSSPRSSANSYDYYMYMSLVISYLSKDFKMKIC